MIFSVTDPAMDTGQPVEMQDDKMSVDGRMRFKLLFGRLNGRFELNRTLISAVGEWTGSGASFPFPLVPAEVG